MSLGRSPARLQLDTPRLRAPVAHVETSGVAKDEVARTLGVHGEIERDRPELTAPADFGAFDRFILEIRDILAALQPVELRRLRWPEAGAQSRVRHVTRGPRVFDADSTSDVVEMIVAIGGPIVETSAEPADRAILPRVAVEHPVVVVVADRLVTQAVHYGPILRELPSHVVKRRAHQALDTVVVVF